MKLLIFLLLLCGEASSQVFTGNAVRFRGRPLTACVPATGEVYVWSGTSWDCGGAGGGGTNGGGNFSASGAPAATSITKIHNGNTTAVIVQCAEDVGGAEVFGTLDRSSATQTTVNFSPALANATTCVFVTGAGSGSAVADQTILGNISGGSATPIGLTAAQVLTLTNAVAGKSSLTTANLIPYVASAGTISQSTTKLNGGIFYPTADSTTAIQFNKADGSTNVLTVDTTNARVGIGTNAPSVSLHISKPTPVFRLQDTTGGETNSSFYGNSGDYAVFSINRNPTTGVFVDTAKASASINLRGIASDSSIDFYSSATNNSAGLARLHISGAGSVGIGTSNTSPSGTLSILDATGGTGSTATWIGHDGSGTYSGAHISAVATTLNVVAGLTQSSTALAQFLDASGTLKASVSSGGLIKSGASLWGMSGNGLISLLWYNTGLQLGSNVPVAWAPNTNDASGTPNVGISPVSAGILGVGTGAAGSVAGATKAAGYMASGGTKFTITGCSADTTAGGATAGTFTSQTTGACTVVITMNGATGLTAPTGWACSASNRTTPANLISQSASSTTTATVTGTTVTGDVISFACIGY